MTRLVKAVRKVENKVVNKLQNSGVIGRSIAKVIKPLLDGKAKVDDQIGKFGRSKLGKVVITAVAIYFGGAALAGAMGGGAAAATGATGWAGAAQGLSGAWAGVTQAGSAIAAGEFSAAGSALSTGAAGGSAGGAATAVATPGAATAAVPELAATSVATPSAAAAAPGWTNVNGLNVLATEAAAPAATQTAGSGMIGTFMNSKTAPALIQAGSGMFSSVGQSQQIEAMKQREDEKEEDRLARYNKNVGTRLWKA